MTRYFLAPRSDETSYENFESTILHGVPYERIEKFLDQSGKEILKKQETIYAWGNGEGRRGEWKKMEEDDVVIFYANGYLIMAGRVIYKQHSPELALEMWPANKKTNEPWAYTFFLADLQNFKIPYEHFRRISGYKMKFVRGFQEVTAPHREEVLRHYESFDELFKTFSEEETTQSKGPRVRVHVNVPSEVEPVKSDKEIVAYKPSETGKTATQRQGFVDFEEVNRHRSKIGSLGEEQVLKYEKNYLASIGCPELAEKVHRTSLDNTSAGYDILSYSSDGEEKYIEVKTTSKKQSKRFSFHISRNEKKVADIKDNYFIYLVFDAYSNNPKVHPIGNPFANEDHLSIEPTSFIVKGNFK